MYRRENREPEIFLGTSNIAGKYETRKRQHVELERSNMGLHGEMCPLWGVDLSMRTCVSPLNFEMLAFPRTELSLRVQGIWKHLRFSGFTAMQPRSTHG